MFYKWGNSERHFHPFRSGVPRQWRTQITSPPLTPRIQIKPLRTSEASGFTREDRLFEDGVSWKAAQKPVFLRREETLHVLALPAWVNN